VRKRLPRGRKVIEKAGGVEAYDQKVRERLKRHSPTIEVKRNVGIVFEE